MLAPLVCGSLAENPSFGWHYGFGAAGVGMLLGVGSFLLFQKTLAGGFPPGRSDAGGARLGAIDYVQVVAIAAICLGLAFAGLRIWPSLRPIWRPPGLGDGLTLASTPGRGRRLPHHLPGFVGRGEVRPSAGSSRRRSGFTAVEWQRLAVILVVGRFSVVFWMGFEQAGRP